MEPAWFLSAAAGSLTLALPCQSQNTERRTVKKKREDKNTEKKSLHSLNTKTNSQQFGCSQDTAGEPQEPQIG